jgi:hypothetical protein
MSRPQNRIRRFVGRQTFADNGRVTFDLPRDYDLETLHIRVTGTAAVTTTYTAVRAEAPTQIAKFVSLKANGTDLLDGLPGVIAHRCGVFRRGQLAPLTPPAGFGVANHTFEANLVLDRAVIDGMRPKDGNFPSRGLSTFQLELQMGACGDLFTGAGVGTITGGTVEIYVVQTQEMVVGGKISLPRVVTKRTHIDIPFPATNANYQQRLNTGNLLRGLIFRATNAGEPSNAVLNNVKIQQGNTVIIDLPYAALRAQNAADYDVTTIPTGIAIVDFMSAGGPYGKLSDCLDLRGGEEIWAYLDVTGGANNAVSISTLEYMPYSPAYWGIAV